MHGLLNLHKPAGITSRDVVNQVQRLVRPAKIGHAGTLDPLATGVLVVCVGAATRLVEYVQRLPKSYEATFLLGRQSDTDDIEGAVVEMPDVRQPSRSDLEAALPRFVGTISQRPPDYSAVKVRGQRAYELARKGEKISLTERTVSVHSLRIVRYEYPVLDVAIECGSGTYVRALGRDLAESLGTRAVMSQLVRTAIGPFKLAAAVHPHSLTANAVPAALFPLEAAVEELPAIRLSDEEIVLIRRGQPISRPQHALPADVAGFDRHGNLIAVLVPHNSDHLRPDKVLSGQ